MAERRVIKEERNSNPKTKSIFFGDEKNETTV